MADIPVIQGKARRARQQLREVTALRNIDGDQLNPRQLRQAGAYGARLLVDGNHAPDAPTWAVKHTHGALYARALSQRGGGEQGAERQA